MPAGFFLALAALVLFPDPGARCVCALRIGGRGPGPGRSGARPHAEARGEPPMTPAMPCSARNERCRLRAHSRAAASCAAGHRRRGAHRPASPGTGSAKAVSAPRPSRRASPQSQLALLFEFLAVALAALIPWGSGADRCGSPPAAQPPRCWPQSSFLSSHWVWAGGWLAQLGVNFGLGAASSTRRRGHRARPRRPERAGRHLDRRLAQRQVSPKRASPPPCPATTPSMSSSAACWRWSGWLAFNARRRNPLAACAAHALPVTAINTLLSASGALAATFAVTRIPLRQARRQPLRQRLARRPGRLQRLRGPRHAGPALFHRHRRRHRIRRCWWNCWNWPSPSTIPPAPSPCTPSAACGDCSPPASSPATGQFCPTGRHRRAARLILPLVYLLFWLLNRVVAFRVDPTASASAWTCTNWAAAPIRSSSFHRDDSYFSK
jgi:hypothetical protein